MQSQFTAIVHHAPDGTYVARCAEVPGTETEASTEQEALENLADAISIVFEVNREEAMREVSPTAFVRSITVDLEASSLVEALPA